MIWLVGKLKFFTTAHKRRSQEAPCSDVHTTRALWQARTPTRLGQLAGHGLVGDSCRVKRDTVSVKSPSQSCWRRESGFSRVWRFTQRWLKLNASGISLLRRSNRQPRARDGATLQKQPLTPLGNALRDPGMVNCNAWQKTLVREAVRAGPTS